MITVVDGVKREGVLKGAGHDGHTSFADSNSTDAHKQPRDTFKIYD